MTQSLHALVITLIAQEDGILPLTVGELAHAAFYAAVQAIDPPLAQQMHDAQQRSAFSLSPLYGYWQSPQDRRIHVRAGQEGWLRLGLLDDHLFALFTQHLLTSSRPTLRLGPVHFAISQVYGAPGSHLGWATPRWPICAPCTSHPTAGRSSLRRPPPSAGARLTIAPAG